MKELKKGRCLAPGGKVSRITKPGPRVPGKKFSFSRSNLQAKDKHKDLKEEVQEEPVQKNLSGGNVELCAKIRKEDRWLDSNKWFSSKNKIRT